MVDFNSTETISKPPREVVALIIIEKLYNYLEADEHYAKTRLNGAGITISVPRARLRSLFLVCHAMLERRLKADEFKEIACVCCDLSKEVHPADLMKCFITILTVLDKLELIKLDTKPVFNRLNVEESNKAQGYG